jgi:hypothetical protein
MASIDELLSDSLSIWTEIAAIAANTGVDGLGWQSDEDVIDVMRRIEETARLVGAAQVQAAAIVDERSKFSLADKGMSYKYGHRHAVHFIEEVTKVSQSEARRRMRMGKDIRDEVLINGEVKPPRYAEVAKAIEAGEIAVPVGERIIQTLGQAHKNRTRTIDKDSTQWDDLMEAAEMQLVEQAKGRSMDLMGVQIIAWRDALDPDGAPLRDDEIHARRGFHQGKERNGITRNTWDTDGPVTAMLKAIFEEAAAANKPRFFTDEQDFQLRMCNVALADADETAARLTEPTLDGTEPDHTDPHAATGGVDCGEFGHVEAIKDNRTKAQRDSDVLTGYLRAGMRASENEMGSLKPTVEVTAVVTLADLEAGRGVGWINGVEESVSIDTIKEMACENGYRPVIVGNSGEILWLGKEPRYFTDPQRRAVILRDGSFCAIKGCTRPARQCHMHHVEFHSLGGPSDVDNAILLCSEHHHMIHRSPFRIEMRNGKPHILAPRWIDPTQSWNPMGTPRFRAPQQTVNPEVQIQPAESWPGPEPADVWTGHPRLDSEPDDLWAGTNSTS